MKVRLYRPSDRVVWNELVRQSRIPHFMFEREYMEYHADRFVDSSLVVLAESGRIVGLFPASRHEDEIVSHGGLSFGGLISTRKVGAALTLEIVQAIVGWCWANDVARLRVKATPAIYHAAPSEEFLYALTRCGASLVRRDISSTLAVNGAPRYGKGRKWSLKHANPDLVVRASDDYENFMQIETDVLVRHGATPTHTAAEIGLLASRFPKNIYLTGAYLADEMVAGVVSYVTPMVHHTQYIGATPLGKEQGAVDRIIDTLIRSAGPARWFDFGISTEDQGRYLNEGLVANKESYGARGVVFDHYELAF